MNTSLAVSRLQHLSHEALLEIAEPDGRTNAGLDAIIVPAARQAKNLTTVIDLAKAANCHLVVLCSKDTRPQTVRRLFKAKNFSKGTAVRVPDDYEHSLLWFKTSEWVKTKEGRSVYGGRESDLSSKRNIGLLMARMLNWHRIFFMDDDIRGVSVGDLNRTISLLGTGSAGHRSAGLRVKCFPDNSVVCHARREVGERQDVFVSGSVLAVDTTAPFAFFPDTYNEDWLFFHQDVADSRLATPGVVHVTQMAKQMRYNPFDPKRAEHQEFGDVIAEGLYSLLHHDHYREAASLTRDYWEEFLHDRQVILYEIDSRIEHAPKELRTGIGEAINAAQRMHKVIDAGKCTSYLMAWHEDLRTWSDRRDKLPYLESTADALNELGLRPI